jgi:hypothetical protein
MDILQNEIFKNPEDINRTLCYCSVDSIWKDYSVIKPPLGIEVIAYNPNWIHPDWNERGMRVGFQNFTQDDDGEFVSAKWWDYQDTYINDEQFKPVLWKHF